MKTAINPQRKNLGGRPREIPSEKVDLTSVRQFAASGCTDKEIAFFIGICERTMAYWKRKDGRFLAALREGHEKATEKVVFSLFMLAVGYDYPVITWVRNNRGKYVIQKIIMKHHHGSLSAIMFWLCNKDKEHWKYPSHIHQASQSENTESRFRIVEIPAFSPLPGSQEPNEKTPPL